MAHRKKEERDRGGRGEKRESRERRQRKVSAQRSIPNGVGTERNARIHPNCPHSPTPPFLLLLHHHHLHWESTEERRRGIGSGEGWGGGEW